MPFNLSSKVILVLQLCPYYLCFLFVFCNLEPKSFLDDRTDEVTVISWTNVDLKRLFILLNVKLTIDVMSEVDEKEEFFVLVYLDAYTIFSSIAKPNCRHIVPKWLLLSLEDRMRWLS